MARPFISPDRLRRFIALLAQHGQVHRAAREASPGRKDPINAFRRARERAPEFADAWERATDPEILATIIPQ